MRISIILAVAVILQPAGRSVAAEQPSRPNVVFVLADDMGYTGLGCYGSKFYETPHIDKLAAEGARFTDGYTCGPNCQPTRAALMSGQYGTRTGVYTVGGIDRFNWRSRPLRPVDNVASLPLETPTIAQVLKDAGYVTGMFGKWHLGGDEAHHPRHRGFDEAIVSEGAHFEFKTDPPTHVDPDVYLADFLTDRAIDFIQRHRHEPFFLYLPHFAVHAPHRAKRELIDVFKNKPGDDGQNNPVYAAMTASVDESVGRIAAKLEELDLARNTLVIFSSDNGGVGGRRDIGLPNEGITDNSPLKGGKGMLWEGGIRVPYIFRWSGKIGPGRVEPTPINSVDLYPTLLEVTQAKPPVGHILDGVSYARLLTDEEPLDREALYWHFPGYLGAGANHWRTTPVGAVRSGDWKLLESFEDGRLELYNLKEDIGEEHNLAAQHPKVVQRLHDQLLEWRSRVGAKMPAKNAHPTAEDEPKKGKKNRQARHARSAR